MLQTGGYTTKGSQVIVCSFSTFKERKAGKIFQGMYFSHVRTFGSPVFPLPVSDGYLLPFIIAESGCSCQATRPFPFVFGVWKRFPLGLVSGTSSGDEWYCCIG